MSSLTRPLFAALIALSATAFTSCSTPVETASINAQAPNGEYKPMVIIQNESAKKIMVGLEGPETRSVSIPARASRAINVLAGTYKYAVSAKNSKTISGTKQFESDRKYDWNFNID